MQLLKLGGSAITAKGGYMKADNAAIAKLAKAGVRDIVLVHGAGSFGHPLVLQYGLDSGVKTMEQQKNCKKVQDACAELSALVAGALKKQGVPAVSVAPHSIAVSKSKRISSLDEKPVFSLLSAGKLPVLYGDMVMDEELGFSVLSGDQLVAYLAKWADRVVMASDVDGIFAEGKLVPKITGKNFARIRAHLSGSKTPDVTGGMAGKIAELEAAGVKAPIFIVNARYPERVKALLLGKKAICTKIML